MEFDILKYNGESPVVIYGAGVYGEYTLRALEFNGLKPVCFCDRAKSGKDYLGFHVYDYKFIDSLDNPVVLLAVGAAYQNAALFLDELNIQYYDIYKLCFEDTVYDIENLSTQARDIAFYKRLYMFGKNIYRHGESFFLYSIDWVITERCSLRCKDCSNLMQYYQSPKNISKDMALKQLKRLLDIVDGIFDVRIIGGEPFMNPEMYDILYEALNLDRISNFSIYTNATILPDSKMKELLKNDKIKCEISDYGELARNFPKFVEIMENEKIRYHVVRMNEWHALGALKNRDMTEAQMKQLFSHCYCNDLLTLLNGKVYRCPYSAHGRNLNAIPYNEEDEVDLFSGSREYLRSKLKFMIFEKNFDNACGYCSGRNYHLGSVPPAVQISQPLDYKRIN